MPPLREKWYPGRGHQEQGCRLPTLHSHVVHRQLQALAPSHHPHCVPLIVIELVPRKERLRAFTCGTKGGVSSAHPPALMWLLQVPPRAHSLTSAHTHAHRYTTHTCAHSQSLHTHPVINTDALGIATLGATPQGGIGKEHGVNSAVPSELCPKALHLETHTYDQHTQPASPQDLPCQCV